MIKNESNKAQPQHRDEQLHQDPGHRRSLLRQGGMGSCLFFTAKSWPLVDEHAAREGPRRTCRERRGRTAGCTISSRRGAGSRRGRRQGAASRAPRSSSARSAPTRQRARSRRRRRSRSSTANGLAAQGGARSKQHAAECRTANGGGRRHHHRQPDVKQGGAAGYLREGGARHINAKPSPVGPSLQ